MLKELKWVLGGPGSGEGTQCEKIKTKYGFTHLSSGELLRNETKKRTKLGKKINQIMQQGELVPIAIVLDLIKKAILEELSTAKSFLIDGYPSEKKQSLAFENSIGQANLILYFDVSEETMTKRLLEGAATSGRADDNLETIKKRLEIFRRNNKDIMHEFRERLWIVDAEREYVESIFDDVENILDAVIKAKNSLRNAV